jgi:hypothetical protein
MKNRDSFDGLWLERFRWQPSEGVLYRELSQPSRDLILQRNAELRKQPGALRDLSFGRLALTIPLEDLDALRAKYPDLASRDAGIRSAAWKRFIASAESKPYRVKG